MKQASLLLSLTLICISNLAFAQSSLRMLVDPNYAVLEKFPKYNRLLPYSVWRLRE
ncbi:MAG: hypothetical protein ACKVG0_01870 [Alphaproteobacteria bacterium]